MFLISYHPTIVSVALKGITSVAAGIAVIRTASGIRWPPLAPSLELQSPTATAIPAAM